MNELTYKFLNKCVENNLISEANINQHGYGSYPLSKMITVLEENKIIDIDDIYNILADIFGYNYTKTMFLPFELVETGDTRLIDFMLNSSILIYNCKNILTYYKNYSNQKLESTKLKELLIFAERNDYIVAYSDCYSSSRKSLIQNFFNINYKNIKYGITIIIPTFLRQELARLKSFYNNLSTIITSDAEDILVDILKQAVFKYRASDIHIEPKEKDADVRLRVDGILKRVYTWDKETYFKVVRVIFLNANVDADKKQYLHDSKLIQTLNDTLYEFRFSAIPTNFGPAVVLRQYTGLANTYKMENLGFSGYGVKILKRMMYAPYGIFLISGPTGSGKTSTLYSMILELGRSLENKVLTVEDPVELNIPFAVQVQVNMNNKVNFATSMRSFLRHDPDIILVGEIRDLETANEAVTAANTGHLVFSTIHTNTSIEILTRLLAIGLERWKITSALLGGMGQRLFKKLCFNCNYKINRAEYKKKLEQIDIFLDDIPYYSKIDEFTISTGCEKCGYSGYIGRTVIYEVFEINDNLKDLIERGCSFLELKKELKALGFKSMIENSEAYIVSGETSVNEMFRLFGSYLYKD